MRKIRQNGTKMQKLKTPTLGGMQEAACLSESSEMFADSTLVMNFLSLLVPLMSVDDWTARAFC